MDQIKKYLIEAGLDEDFVKRKVLTYSKHPDIAEEFSDWIRSGHYRDNGLEVQGYTAKQLAELSQYLVGEASFSMMIMLRENPKKALSKIKGGFKVK
jgi:hypothetical protein